MMYFEKINSMLEDQKTYYRKRAKEYNEWFYRQGRYDRGEEDRRKWFEEITQVRGALEVFNPSGNVLEIACGTGLWTEQLIRYADKITALDASEEMISINREYVKSLKVRYITGDIFGWIPDQRYDVIFFGFWISHVPMEKFKDFWNIVDEALKPGGRVFFTDSVYNKENETRVKKLDNSETMMTRRVLNNGLEYIIIKNLYKKDELTEILCDLGWEFDIRETGHFIIYGSGCKNIK